MIEHLPSPAKPPLFFSGGTALGPVTRCLARHTPHSVHVITPFDSGGSSAILRDAFRMPAVGDIRARILALADLSRPGVPELVALCAHRLPKNATPDALRHELEALIRGEHPLCAPFAAAGGLESLYDKPRKWLTAFAHAMPEGLSLAGASVGNLMLTAVYLAHGHNLEPMAQALGQLVHARGHVLPATNAHAHLSVRLADGTVIVGQHRFTGKDFPPISAPVHSLHLVKSLDDATPTQVQASPAVLASLGAASFICYPVGSFFSSVLANLLPVGMAAAVAAAPCPKLFVPNTSPDPELFGLTLTDQIRFLCEAVAPHNPRAALTTLLLDTDDARYPGGVPTDWLEHHGITVLRHPLVTPPFEPHADPEILCNALMQHLVTS